MPTVSALDEERIKQLKLVMKSTTKDKIDEVHERIDTIETTKYVRDETIANLKCKIDDFKQRDQDENMIIASQQENQSVLFLRNNENCSKSI